MKKNYFLNSILMLFLLAFGFLTEAQVPNNGLIFDGVNDYVSVESDSMDEFNPFESLSLECWVNLNAPTDSTHFPHLIAKVPSYALTVGASGLATLYVFTDSSGWSAVASTTTILPNQWYHLAGTYDGSDLRIYVNGVEEASAALTDSLNQTNDEVRIGARNTGPGISNTNGMIDEARIWNVVRSQSQIQSSMNQTIPGYTSGLSGYWMFDESSGTNADCETPADNDGTLINMSVPAAWDVSTVPVGETSIFSVSSDIYETSLCEIDVNFRTGSESPGTGRSIAAMQVNELPNSVSGLYPDRSQIYWEIWSEDPNFDGDFTVDVRFHYDNVTGINSETSLELFRRDDANGTWSPVTGYSVISTDGGSSSGTDGIGYVEYTITENTAGLFGGQYILSWSNEPPVVSNIPNQSVPEGTAFSTIMLDNYVNDPDNADDEIIWTVSGETNVTVDITNRVATITADDPEWSGTDVITFTATDPEGEGDSDDVTFEVTTVFDPPVVGDIPDQEIVEGASFTTITLDNFVTDADNDITTMTWTASGQTDLVVDITNRIATITVNDPEWNGSETITFQAEDPDGETDSDQASFTVTPVNDAPVLDEIPRQSINEGESFTQINLDDYVDDVDDADSTLIWTISGDSQVTVDLNDRVATVTVNDPEWNGADWVIFTVADPDGLLDRDTVRFAVAAVNDLPVIDDIPDQTIAEGQSFSQLNLDAFVADADDVDDSLSWTTMGQSDITVTIVDRVATFTVDPEWNGSETIIFTATDPLGASDADTSVLTVTAVNDAPTLSKAIPDTSVEAGEVFLFVLDPGTFADADPGDVLVLSASMSMGGSTPAWLTFDPASGTFSGTPADADKGMVEVIVTATDGSSASIADTFSIEVISYVGISNPLEVLEINLYPNPNNGRFVIESDRFEGMDVVLEIFNEKGQLIWNREIRNEMVTLHESVDLDNAAEGLYLLRVRNNSGVINKRFVIAY